MQLKVRIVGITRFVDEAAIEASGGVWRPDPRASDGESLVEFAGRSCYQSWNKPNPRTARNADYLAHIEEVGHWSVMRHASVTFYITGVSRSLTHELVRHHHLDPSQLSQRFVVLEAGVPSKDDFITPPLFEGDDEAGEILLFAWERAVDAYEGLLARATRILEDQGLKGSAASKRAREAARAVLPNMTPTAITITGNHDAWRKVLLARLQPEADAEIRQLSEVLFNMLYDEEPSLYQDLHIQYVNGIPSLKQIPSKE